MANITDVIAVNTRDVSQTVPVKGYVMLFHFGAGRLVLARKQVS